MFQRLLPALTLSLMCLLSPLALATDTDGDGVDDVGGVTLYGTSFDTAGTGWVYGQWGRVTDATNARTPSVVASTGNCFRGCSTTSMTFTFNVTQPSYISFWAKANGSSNSPLPFLIDNVSQGNYSVDKYAYKQKQVFVGAGSHVFKWTASPSTSVQFFVDDVSITTATDNCQMAVNPDQKDNDGDNQGDVCDADDDSDSIDDVSDNCPLNSNANQLNTDGDAQGNVCDADDDNDGVLDAADRFPLDATETTDSDNDGTGNNADSDDDNDGLADGSDNCPLSYTLSTDQTDTDSDGQGNVCDTDDDNDGVADNAEPYPLDAARSAVDTGLLNTFYGDSAGDEAGYSVSGAGDVNNDGYADIIVGAHGDDNNGSYSGSARIFSGANGAILYTLNGDEGDEFGIAVSGAGDVNNDDYADVIVGSSGDDGITGTVHSAGSARVYSGADGSLLYTFHGSFPSEYLGRAVAGAGDVDNDGYDDLIVGSSLDNSGAGKTTIFSGQNGAAIYTFYGAANDRFGASVSGAGDVNGDGYVDVVAGSCNFAGTGAYTGSVKVFSGVDGAVLHTFTSGLVTDYIGCSVSGAGDVNGDGYADIVTGVYKSNTAGRARVYSGSDGAVLYDLTRPYASTGYVVSGAGDVNNDSYDDVMLSDNSNYASGAMGNVALYSGANGSVLYTFSGVGSSALGYAGDVNADGYADVVIGSYGASVNGAASGMARAFSGKALWTDTDSDGQNNAVDSDDDNDGVVDTADQYPVNAAAALDADNDGLSDWNVACDTSCQAASGLTHDNCPAISNVDQLDTDSDSIGDVCDSDLDNDGVTNALDRFPLSVAASVDGDNDGYPEAWNAGCDDACQLTSGLMIDAFPSSPCGAVDTDGDGQPDSLFTCSVLLTADSFETGDFSLWSWTTGGDANWFVQNTGKHTGVYAAQSASALTQGQGSWLQLAYNAPQGANRISFWAGAASGTGIASPQPKCNFYIDGNKVGICENYTWFQLEFNTSPGAHTYKWEFVVGAPGTVSATYLDDVKFYGADLIADTDDDNDSVLDINDAFPLNAAESLDTDGDGIGDNADTDDDGDGVADTAPALLYTESFESGWRTGWSPGFGWGREYIDTRARTGVYAAEGTDIFGRGQMVNFTYTAAENAIISYWVKSVNGYSSIRFSAVGISQSTSSNKYTWTNVKIALAPGTYHFSWTVMGSSNATYLDDVTIESATRTELLDNCPVSANTDQLNTDGDAQGNACDSDDDNDSVLDVNDAFSLDATESVDSDNDGIGNNADLDDDNDGFSDVDELTAGTDPLNASSHPLVTGISGDTDGDGYADIVTWSSTTGNGYQYLMGSNNLRAAAPNTGTAFVGLLPSAYTQYALADFNRDGSQDTLLRNNSNGTWAMLEYNIGSPGSVAMNVPMSVDLADVFVAAADINGDGYKDVLLRNTSTGVWTLNLLQGDVVLSSSAIAATLLPDWQTAAVADFNGDGKADLLLRNTTTQMWYLYELDGAAVLRSGVIGMAGTGWNLAGVGDFNADGIQDVLVRRASDSAWYEYTFNDYANAGTTRFKSSGSMGLTPTGAAGLAWSVLALADVDGSGTTDVLLYRSSDRQYFMYGLGGVTGRTVVGATVLPISTNPNWVYQTMADYNGDGKLDFLVRWIPTGSFYTGKSYMYGFGSYTAGAVWSYQGYATSITTDVNAQVVK